MSAETFLEPQGSHVFDSVWVLPRRIVTSLRAHVGTVAAVALVSGGGLLRLLAASHSDTLVDEPIYRYAAAFTLGHGYPAIRPPAGQHVQAFLYHPPFYFYLLAGWFWLWHSTSMLTARMFSVFVTTMSLAMLYLLAKRLMGSREALVALLLVSLDPWIILTNQAVYIENVLLVLVLLAVLAYRRAQDATSETLSTQRNRYIVAGLALGEIG